MQNEESPKPVSEEGQEVKETADGKEPEKEESFSFLRETIKPKPISREKILMQFARMAIYGLIIGAFACCSFFALKPWAENTFHGDPEKVTIPEDEEDPEQEDEAAAEEPEPVIQTLDIESYQQMMDSLYETVREAKKGVVSVRAKSEADWTEERARTNTNAGSSTGLIAADNGQELLILSDNAVCADSTEWEVVFADGSKYAASLKKQDKNRGLAVFSVARNALADSVWNSIHVAALGNSNLARQGGMVIALGNVFGYEDGLGYGVISSVNYDEIFADGQCRTIATDIVMTGAGNGILLNLDGEVLGIIRDGVLSGGGSDKSGDTANALAISDLKEVMELMLNGKSVPYAGLYGVTVTAAVAEEQAIPEGLYVTRVESDSPAMAAGIQNGDIIESVDGQTVTGAAAFESALLDCAAGEAVNVRGQRRGASGYVDVKFTLTVGSME